jgi:antitoxin HicB
MASAEIEAQIAEIMKRPYRIVIEGDPVDGFVGKVPELPGCLTAGDTPEEALLRLTEAMAGWIEVSLERGLPIPEPAAASASR